jgi:hypothetical protein
VYRTTVWLADDLSAAQAITAGRPTMTSRLRWCALLAAVVMASCAETTGGGTGGFAAMGAPCLSPMRAGDGDVAIRDISVVVHPGGRKAAVHACVVSDRHERLASVTAEFGVLSHRVPVDSDRGFVAWGGNGRSLVSAVLDRMRDMPRLVALLSTEVELSSAFGGRPIDAVVVRLSYQACWTNVDRCVPDGVVRQAFVPATVERLKR